MKEHLPIKTALLSYGMSGEIFHTPLIEAYPRFSIKAIFQRNPTKPARHSYPVTHQLQEILDNPEIEMVIVNTPNENHYDDAKRALLAGKHVVVEKPFTVTTREADDLIALAADKGKMLTVFQNRRWDGDFLTVRDIIEKRTLGKLVEFEAHYDRFRNGIDTSSWKENPEDGTGVLYNLGSHMIDQILVLFGLPDYLDARLGIQRPGGKVHDFYDIRMEYEHHLVILKSSYLVREPGPRYILHGTEGSFVKYGIDPQEQDMKDKKTPGTEGWGAESQEWWGKLNTEGYNGPIETVPGNYLLFYQNIYEHLRWAKPLMVKPQDARDVIRLIEACFESNSRRSAIKIA